MLSHLHHIAIICRDYEVSKQFYTQVLGLTIQAETFRKERNSYKLDLCLNGVYLIELFSFPHPSPRASMPEATGLRHLAFAVDDLTAVHRYMISQQIYTEEIRIDEFTGKRFFFIEDPDKLPIEFYEH